MATVRDNPEQTRYEIEADDGRLGAFVRYRLIARPDATVADFVHTETEPGYQGQGLASALLRGALDDARRRGWAVLPSCPFVLAYLGKHPDYVDLVPADDRPRFGLD
jgi:predicted GNAT family acetyltransferase